MNNCIFCKIVKKEISAEIVFEDDSVLAFHDINPITPIHILVIPKKHIASVNEISEEDSILIGNLVFSAKKIAKEMGFSEDGYKLLFRIGKNGGQEVGHVHMHLLGGAKMYEEIRAE